jgi:putative endonuclease
MALLARIVYDLLLRKENGRARLLYAAPESQNSSGSIPVHLATGRCGERLAYWYLRRAGYIVVARNLRARPGSGELDLVAWEGPILAFVEVKTRTSSDPGPPKTAVTFEQQKRIAAAAQLYIRGLKQKAVNYRFDVVTVGWDQQDGYQIRLIKGAFKG